MSKMNQFILQWGRVCPKWKRIFLTITAGNYCGNFRNEIVRPGISCTFTQCSTPKGVIKKETKRRESKKKKEQRKCGATTHNWPIVKLHRRNLFLIEIILFVCLCVCVCAPNLTQFSPPSPPPTDSRAHTHTQLGAPAGMSPVTPSSSLGDVGRRSHKSIVMMCDKSQKQLSYLFRGLGLYVAVH